MKFTINTAKMNTILSAVAKGVGNKYTLPITEYLHLKLEDNTLSVTATDTTNFITYYDTDIEGENGESIVKASTLIKLASKTTKPEMKFNLTDSHLEVKGNGTYKIEVLEESEFPTYEIDNQLSKVEMDTVELKQLFKTNQSAIANDLVMPALTGYNVGERATTTDGIKMCINETKVFEQHQTLIPQALADLVTVLTGEKVTVIKSDDNSIAFETDNIVIFGSELDGLEEYPDITPFLSLDFEDYAKVSKQELSKALDRLSLFVDAYDNSGIKLTFTADSVNIQDFKHNSKEVIEAETSLDSEDSETITVNLEFLSDLLSVLKEPKVTLEFGEDLPIKIKEDNVTQILSLMDEE